MDMRKLLVLGCIAVAVLVSVEPAGALLWPPVIGTCGLGGIFGPLGLNGLAGPFGTLLSPYVCGPFGSPLDIPLGFALGGFGAGCGCPF